METRESVRKRGLKFGVEALNQLDIKAEKLKKEKTKLYYQELARRRKAKKLRKKLKRLEKSLGLNKKKARKKKVLPVQPTTGEEYKAQYEHPLWRKRRSEILKRDNHACVKCGCKVDLQVHHLIYQYGFNLWEYKDECLITVCQSCHEQIHREQPITSFYNKGVPLEKYILKL